MGMKKKQTDMERIKESYPTIGADYSDFGWTLLTKDDYRDLSPMIQDRMQDIAFYLYDSNPIAHRIIEMTKDFIIGDGFSYKAEDERVQEVLDRHWEDNVNNWDLKQDIKAKELGLFGEQFYPVFVNPYNGNVRLGYLDPTRVKQVFPDRKNPEVLKKVTLKQNRSGKEKSYEVINIDNDKRSETYGKLIGEIFVFQINKVTNSMRGRSDLLSLADWIDGYDQFLFARLERANILNNFVWDITLEGMNDGDIQKWLTGQSTPKPGSMRAHNEKVKWEAASPKLESSDASKEAQLFKMQILGGAGFPNLWFGEGGETIRAGAVEMSLPTLKHLRSRQKYFKFMIKHIFNFVIDQAIIAKKLPEDVNKKFVIKTPPITKKQELRLGVSAGRVTDAVKSALDNNWITLEEAKKIWRNFMTEVCGMDLSETVTKENKGEHR